MDMREVAGFIASGAIALPPRTTVAQGAATSVLLAASPTVEGITGRCFEDCAEAEPVAGVEPRPGRLWAVSEDLARSPNRRRVREVTPSPRRGRRGTR
jgi:hypothetical protein